VGNNKKIVKGEIYMKRVILMTTVCLLVATGLVKAEAGELSGTVDVTFQSKYIWRGFDVYDDKSAIQPSVNLDLFGTGFGVSATAHRANSSGHELGERWDYYVHYGGKLFEDELYATMWRMGYVYYNFPEFSSHKSGSPDLEELHWILSFPNALPVKGLVPTYILVKLWPSNSCSIQHQLGGHTSGFAHIFMLDYGLPIPGILPDTDEQILRIHTELVFNDGVHPPPGGNADHDWSNFVFGVETDFDLGNNMSLTPGIYQQLSMDDSVNCEDETWINLSLKYRF
jgi:hypothetical protein